MYEDQLTYGERKKLNEKTKNETLILMLFGLIMFITGIVVGSAIHDGLYHPSELTTLESK